MASLRISLWIPNTAIALAWVLTGGAIAAAIGNEATLAVIVGSIGGTVLVVGVGWFVVVQSQRGLIKKRLGVFLEGGTALVEATHNLKMPPPGTEADEWAKEVETFLRKYLGESCVARFHSGAGLPSGYTTLASAERRQLEAALKTWLARLHQFLEELGA